MANPSWTDELKKEVVDAYLSRNPTPETTTDIIAELAEEYDKTVNGIRIILTKAGAYVKKEPAKKPGGGSSGGKRVNKAEAQASLTEAIEAAGLEVDEDIISKLTGKAAKYFSEIINNLRSE